MMNYVSIGPSPCNEDCAQVGQPDYREKATEECKRFIALIREKLGPEPPGALLRIKWNDHDFGSYADVVCAYNDNDEEATEYAYHCEANAPVTWAE